MSSSPSLSCVYSSLIPTVVYFFTSDSYASRYQSRVYGGLTPRDSIFSRFQSYGATDSERRTEDNAHGMSSVGLLLRVLGLSCMYAALVMLLKYGGP